MLINKTLQDKVEDNSLELEDIVNSIVSKYTDKLDEYMEYKYTEMKAVIDIDNMYELMSDTVDDFLGQKSYEDNMIVYDWEEQDTEYLEHVVDEPAQV